MTRAGFEFGEMNQLVGQFRQAIDGQVIDGFIREILLDMAKKLISKTKRRTPVNTGLLRNSWMIGNVERHGDNYIVEVYTDLEYAGFIENGFRAHWVPGKWVGNQFVYDENAKTGMQVGEKGKWVEGKFMLKISLKEVEREMPGYVQRKQTELLNRMMGGG